MTETRAAFLQHTDWCQRNARIAVTENDLYDGVESHEDDERVVEMAAEWLITETVACQCR